MFEETQGYFKEDDINSFTDKIIGYSDETAGFYSERVWG